jgi:hypothetical protein
MLSAAAHFCRYLAQHKDVAFVVESNCFTRRAKEIGDVVH